MDHPVSLGQKLALLRESRMHSRLSHKLDFGKEWFEMPCSDEYWSAVEPIFDLLKEEKANGTKWSEIEDKNQKGN